MDWFKIQKGITDPHRTIQIWLNKETQNSIPELVLQMEDILIKVKENTQ